MVEPIDDPTNITGLSALINRGKANPNLDLAMSETKFIGGRVPLREEVNAEQEFSRLMDGIYGRPGDNPAPSGNTSGQRSARPPAPRVSFGLPNEAPRPPPNAPGQTEDNFPEDPALEDVDLGDWDAPPGFDTGSPLEAAAPPATTATPGLAPPLLYQPPGAYNPPYNPPAYNQPRDSPARVAAQARGWDPVQAGLEAYSGSLVGTTDLEREEQEEDKQYMLECIDDLISELRTLNVDTSRVRVVNSDNSFEDVQKVYNLLQRKYDRARCDMVGTDLIVAGAQILGTVLDGTRGIGNIRPNLDGWHNTIRPRLRRTRYEISTLTSGVLKQCGVGPAGRLAIELVPSAVLYSNMRAGQTAPDRYSEDQMAAAFDDLRQYE